MADETNENTGPKTRTITIAKLAVTLPDVYTEGHVVSAAEANALNQVRAEAIRNNNAKRVQKAVATANEGVDEADQIDIFPANSKEAKALVKEILEYADEYQFTLATAGAGRTSRDPVESMAIKIATDMLNAKLGEKSTTVAKMRKTSEQAKEAINAKIAEVAQMPKVVEAAKKEVARRAAEAEKLASLEINLD